MKWVVDIREPQELINYFITNHSATTAKLEVGDYTVDDLLGIERKAYDFLDFTRTLSQIDELVDRYTIPCLIVEVSLLDLIKKSQELFHKNMLGNILGVVSSLTVRGCPPIFCGNQTVMLTVMEKIAEKSLDGKVRRIKRILRTQHYDHEDIAVNVLRGFGLGINKAEEVSKKYDGDLRVIIDILLNKPEELKEIYGVGQGTVNDIINALKPRGVKNGPESTVDGKVPAEKPF